MAGPRAPADLPERGRIDLGDLPEAYDAGDIKLEFKYDYMGRRFEKKSSTYSGSAWALQATERFVYDGWNVIMVLDGDNNTVRKYTWGLDLSGQRGNPTLAGIHGAGGIGGLLACEETATTNQPKYWFFYDANGNVQQVLENTTNYPVVAHYEYEPYGKGITAETTGSYAATNPFRFSTKWVDGETGMYYFGHRYYEPAVGRWVNRDPLDETGGLNLYSYVHDAPVSAIDPLGLQAGLDNLCTLDLRQPGGPAETIYNPSPIECRSPHCCCPAELPPPAGFVPWPFTKMPLQTADMGGTVTFGVRCINRTPLQARGDGQVGPGVQVKTQLGV